MNYIAEATQRWPGAKILGDGRYACVAQNGGLVYLAMTESQQRSISLGVDGPVLEDLKPKFIPFIKDDEDDVRYEREERRREKANQMRFPK